MEEDKNLRESRTDDYWKTRTSEEGIRTKVNHRPKHDSFSFSYQETQSHPRLSLIVCSATSLFCPINQGL